MTETIRVVCRLRPSNEMETKEAIKMVCICVYYIHFMDIIDSFIFLLNLFV